MVKVDSKSSPQNEKDKKISLLLEDLASLEAYIRDVFTFYPLPICFASPLGVILESNPAFEKISDLSFAEVIGKVIEKLFEKEEIEKLAKDTTERGFVEGREMKFFPKGKTWITVQVFTRVREDERGKAVGYFLGLFDLTKIKKTERELRKRVEQLERFHKLIIGRELKMVELKKEINRLKKELEKRKK